MLTAQDGEWCEASPSPAGQSRAGSSEVPRCTSCAPRPAAFLAHLVDELRRVGSLHIDRLAFDVIVELLLHIQHELRGAIGHPSIWTPQGPTLFQRRDIEVLVARAVVLRHPGGDLICGVY